MIATVSKEQIVLNLLTGAELTRVEAIAKYDCANLPSMIAKLRARKYRIRTMMREGYAVYQLEAPDSLTLPLFGE